MLLLTGRKNKGLAGYFNRCETLPVFSILGKTHSVKWLNQSAIVIEL